MSAAEWQPIFERALKEYAMEQEGFMVEINCRNVLKFMAKHPGYPSLDDEAEQRHVTKLLDGFFGRFFGPLWDGTKYRDFRHDKGRSLHIGTGNVLDLIKNGDSVRAIHHEGVR